MFDLEDYKTYVKSKCIGRAIYLKVDITDQLLDALFQFEEAPSCFLKHIPDPRIAEKYRKIFNLADKNNKALMNNWFLYTYGFKYCGHCKSIKELSEFSNNKHVWDNKTTHCSICMNAISYKWNADNKSTRKQVVKKYQQTHKEIVTKSAKKYRLANLDKNAAKTAKRRATKLSATPLWLSKEQQLAILEFYKEAKKMEMLTGIKHHVDHIVPLQGSNVCGLHVPWNLQIIPAEENIRKSNKWQN